MRNIYLLFVCILYCNFIFADDCTEGLTEAKALYNSGNYQKAKELFEYVKSECPQNYTEASHWIAKCDDALKPKASNTKQSTSKTSSSTTSYLKVNGYASNSTVFLMNSSSSKTITISCSTSYSIYNIPSWCSITNRTSTSFTLNYQANPNTYTRYGSIDISGGGTSIRLSLEQTAKTTTSSNSSSTTSSANSSSLKVNKSLIVATAKGVTDYITVTSNKAWEIQYPNGGIYTATRNGNSVKVVIFANSTTSQRTDFFNIRTTDGKETIKISLSQSGMSSTTTSNSSSKTSSSSSSSLKVNKSLIVATAKGVTDYITVTCNKAWEIQYPSGGMYTATRSGNNVKVVISANLTTSQRTDFFNIRTTDGKETIKISLSQSGKSSTNSSYSSYNSSRNYSLSKYQQYTRYCGDYEITWFGMRAGICTGVSYGYRLLSFRLGPVQINPIEITADYNFVNDEIAAVYTPSIDFFIPFQDDAALYFGAGPSIHIADVGTYTWADVSAGIHWHWGDAASSDFFMRYNGSFMFGVSIQWSTDF